MNEKIRKEESVSVKNKNTEQIIKIIADKMLETRPEGKVRFMPYIKTDAVYHRPSLRALEVNLYKYYPQAQDNDTAFCSTHFTSDRRQEVTLSIWGKVKAFYKGKEVLCSYDDIYDFPLNHVNVVLEEGYNELTVECVAKKGYFGFWVLASLPFYKGMWAKDYLFCTRATLPENEFEGEEGVAVSKLYQNAGESDDGLAAVRNEFFASHKKYSFPSKTNIDSKIDFNNLFKEEKGCCAYALTYCKNDGDIKIHNFSPIKILVNEKVICSESEIKEFVINVKKGDCVLIKSLRTENGWGFYNETKEIHLPFLCSNRKDKLRWIVTGAFGETDSLDMRYGPEFDISFEKNYINADGNRAYWRFSQSDTYLRPYLDTTFYSQWYYALMVGHYGLKLAAETLNNQEYMEYYISSITTMAEYFDYMKYDNETFGDTTFMQRCVNIKDWDNIGTIGMNMAEVYVKTGNKEILAVIERLAAIYKKEIPRFDDGTFRRENTMWADDLFMSLPFIARLGRLLDDSSYYDECIKQIEGFRKKLFMEDKKLFSHIFFPNENTANYVPWGRGNGWIMVALSEVLLLLPEDTKEKQNVIALFNDFAQGISQYQDECGMWHQVIDRKESYLETSASAMFVLALARGVRYGWIDEKYKATAVKGWKALCESAIDADGNIYGVCKGSGCHMEAEYYMNLDTVCNDDHGSGIVLAAACELTKLGV